MRFSISLALFVLVFCGCGDDLSTGDAPPTIDGHTYKTVKIGDQEWFAENLRTTVYANGDEIFYGITEQIWTTRKTGMRCYYNHDDSMNAKYGQLYNWYAVDDPRGLCPSGWHVPTEEDWQDLEVFLGGSRTDVIENVVFRDGYRGSSELGSGTKLKASNGWELDGNGTDDFGFSALPGGIRGDYGGFYRVGEAGHWWTSSSIAFKNNSSGPAFWRCLHFDDPGIWHGEEPFSGSVRCLRDAE